MPKAKMEGPQQLASPQRHRQPQLHRRRHQQHQKRQQKPWREQQISERWRETETLAECGTLLALLPGSAVILIRPHGHRKPDQPAEPAVAEETVAVSPRKAGVVTTRE